MSKLSKDIEAVWTHDRSIIDKGNYQIIDGRLVIDNRSDISKKIGLKSPDLPKNCTKCDKPNPDWNWNFLCNKCRPHLYLINGKMFWDNE